MAPTILDVQKFWDARPCNIMHGQSPVGSPEYMVETTKRKRKVEPHVPDFVQFDKWHEKKVLEIGCGIGIDAVQFAACGAEVTAVDVSEKSLDIARRRAELARVEIDFKQADAEWPLGVSKDHVFDLVYAFGSIHHSPNPRVALRFANYFLKPGGALKLMVYNKYSWKSLWILLKYGKGKFWKFSELIAKYSEAQTGCPITHVYSRRSIKKLVESEGFKVKSIKADHIFPYSIPEYKQYRYVRAFPWNIIKGRPFRLLERLFGWHLLLEATT